MLSEMILRTDVSENKVREWENKFLKVIFAIKGCRGALWFWKNFKLYLNLRQKAMGDAFKSAWSLAEESKMRKEILEGLMKLGY